MADVISPSSGPITQPARTHTDNSLDSAIAETLVALIAGEITEAEAVPHLQILFRRRTASRSDGAAQHYGPMSDAVQKVLG